MKRFFLLLGVCVLVLLGVLTGRMLLLPAPQVNSNAPVMPAGISAQRVAEHLGEAIRFQTISVPVGLGEQATREGRETFAAMREWILHTYPLLAANAQPEVVGGSLLLTWPGRNPQLQPVMLMAHMDVVPIAPDSTDQWQYPPFSGALADGFVWGRGAIDTKGSLVAMLEAAETLLSQGFQPERTVLFAFGHDEEIGGFDGNRRIAEQLQKQGVKLAWVSDEGGAVTQGMVPGVEANVAIIGIAEKGGVSLLVKASSTGGHSSIPLPFEQTAIGRLSLALQHISEKPFDTHLQGPTTVFLESVAPAQSFAQRLVLANLWLFGPLVNRMLQATPSGDAQLHTSIAPTIISGGNKENVLPPSAKAVVNLRIHPQDSIDSVRQHVLAAVNDPQVSVKVMPGAREPSAVSDVNGAAYQYLSQTIRDSFANTLVAPNLTVGGTDSRYYLPLTNNVFRFAPILMAPEDFQRFHGNNERIGIETMGNAAAFYYRLLGKLPATDD